MVRTTSLSTRSVIAVGFTVAFAVAASASINLVAGVVFGLTAAALLAHVWELRRKLAHSSRSIAAYDGNTLQAPFEDERIGIGGCDEDYTPLTPAHSLDGLSTRDSLIQRICTDGQGVLGAIAFADFDRMTAFDPALSERVLAGSIARLQAMLPKERFASKVGPGLVGIWFGNCGEADARGELDAIAYALGEVIEDSGQSIVPQIRFRLDRFQPSEGIDPARFLARTLAALSLGTGREAPGAAAAELASLAREDYSLEQDLRLAIGKRELRLEFQPLIDASQGCVCGAEALIRWDHSERGPISPVQFVPVAEAIGLTCEIGMWALNAAVREAHSWIVQGVPNVRVAVNVSGRQLEADDLPIQIQRTLQRHELSATVLEIELTESVATSDAEHCRSIFQELRTMGVKLAVDDFGTGYSGFSSLRTLAFDKVKIDREFVTAVDSRSDSQAICQSIIALGRGLGIRVLAEGVERREEYEWLRRHGCLHFQGYYFARPMSSAAFVEFVRNTTHLGEKLRLKTEVHSASERLWA